MAADYALKSGEYEGVVLLAAYTSKNLSKTDMRVLSVYGSEDGILNRKAYERSKSKLPSDFTEQVIEGGNHSGFAFYGEQKGDGKATISAADQTKKTADIIAAFITGIETESTASDGTEESLEN